MLAFTIDIIDNRFVIKMTERHLPVVTQGHTVQDLIDAGRHRVTEIETIKIKDTEDELAEQVLGMILEWAKEYKKDKDKSELVAM